MTQTPDRDTIPVLPREPEALRLGPGPPRGAGVSPPGATSAATTRPKAPDLHLFFDGAVPLERRQAPARSLALAGSLYDWLADAPAQEGAARDPARAVGHAGEPGAVSLRERIVTDSMLRAEADRDQNVYLGKLFTRTLTRAVPDVIFQPAGLAECAAALRWARERRVPVTLRGAASTAMGGAVPNDGGLTLDLARLDGIDIDAAHGVCVVGAGTRLRTLHQRLAESGLALQVYPSNLGGTLAGWFATGGIGLNAFGHGRAIDSVLAADLLLPSGEHLRFHADGRLDVPDGARRKTLPAYAASDWFVAQGLEPMTLADLAGSEGAFGLLSQLTVKVERRPEIGAFLLGFDRAEAALEAATWIAGHAGERCPRPANLKFLSGSHLEHSRRVWRDDDARAWRRLPSALSSGANLPWTRNAGPADLGARVSEDPKGEAYLFIDFLDLASARSFAQVLAEVPGSPAALGAESVRFAAERFRPQQTKRLGPGLLAAEILMPTAEVARFLPRAERLAANAGSRLDAEVYFLADGTALAIGGYLTDHRSGAFALDLMIAPALLDLAMRRHHGQPYVLGRWQAAWAARKFGAAGVKRLRKLKQSLDPDALLSRGVLLGLKLRGPLGALLGATFEPGVSMVRGLFGAPPLVRAARAVLRLFPGPAHGRGAPVEHGDHEAHAGAAEATATDGAQGAVAGPPVEDRALHCVNCGECNTVCPIFSESKIRLPQMLTHFGEGLRGGAPVTASGSVLLDLCMRCGNCEEVCQAGIPHLPLYDVMQRASDRVTPAGAPAPDVAPVAAASGPQPAAEIAPAEIGPPRRGRDRARHVAIVSALRGSNRYLREFLRVRPGGYLKRSPASLPGVARYLVLRAEGDAGPAATCIHCGACVSACPTHANREFEGEDPRWITTLQERCIGCGSCVEVCPANHLNGGQTLRVMEAPARDWFLALEEFEGRADR